MAATPTPYGALKHQLNFRVCVIGIGGGNANALRGTETKADHSADRTIRAVAATPTPYGALKHEIEGTVDDLLVRGGNANALRGTETCEWFPNQRLQPCGGNANALRGTETCALRARACVVQHGGGNANALRGTETIACHGF